MSKLTIDNLRHIVRHYKGSKDANERLIRLKASSELIRRIKVIQNYKLSHNETNKGE